MDSKERATTIIKKLVKEGHIAYFAGGWVRDYLMGHPSSDIDIATDAPPQKILDLFPHTVPVGLAFGVIIVVFEGQPFEVSTFRRDIAYLDGRYPNRIELSSPEEDAIRRDFTINGMFYDPIEDKILDFVHGKEDLKKGIIRAIGDPSERFFEDRLRMIRAIRFAARFGFHMDLETQEGIKENAESLFPAVAMERIWQEFNKMAKAPRFDMALIEMHRLGLLQVIFPSLRSVHLHDIKNRVASFALLSQNTPTILYLMELFPEANLNEMKDLCFYLKTSAHDIKLVEFIFKNKTHVEAFDNLDKVSWVYFYGHPYSQLCLEIVAAHYDLSKRQRLIQYHEKKQKDLEQHIQRIIQKKPLVDGDLLIKNGIPQGRRMGALLKEAERLVIMHDLTDPDEVVALLTQSANWQDSN